MVLTERGGPCPLLEINCHIASEGAQKAGPEGRRTVQYRIDSFDRLDGWHIIRFTIRLIPECWWLNVCVQYVPSNAVLRDDQGGCVKAHTYFLHSAIVTKQLNASKNASTSVQSLMAIFNSLYDTLVNLQSYVTVITLPAYTQSLLYTDIWTRVSSSLLRVV